MTQDLDRTVVAVDIGGSKVLAALFSPGGKLLSSKTIPTLVEEGADAVIERLGDCIEEVLTNAGKTAADTTGIGIACAGGIDTQRGMVVTPSPNLPDWADVPLAARMRKRFEIPVYVINDASAAALGEHRFGAGRGVNNLVLLTLGTGIGGGIITNGKLYLGALGAAAEIGHMAIAEGPPCGCGSSGCLEMLASGTAVERDAAARLEHGEKSLLREMVGSDFQSVTAEQVGEAARKGDLLARQVLASAAHYLGVGMVNLVNIFNPDMIIAGGGMAALGDMLLGPAREMVDRCAFGISARAVKIVTAVLGNDAGIYGAAAYVMESQHSNLKGQS